MQNIFKDELFTRRNKDTHARHISLLQIDPIYSSIYGLKLDSLFNEQTNFNTSIMLPPDPMNDLLEGIVPMELKLIIKRLISSGYFNLKQLNAKIVSFNFGVNDIFK